MSHLRRILPFIESLRHSPVRNQLAILKSFPASVTDGIIEVLYNILSANIKVKNSRYRQVLYKNRKKLEEIYSTSRNKAVRKRVLYKQRGGFISAMLPIIAATLSGIIGSAL